MSSPESVGRPGGLAVRLRDRAGTEAGIVEGLAVVEHGVPFGMDTVVNTGSVAKQFVALLAMTAVRRGLLGLEDRTDRWLDGVGPAAGSVTVEQLMHHTSGIRDAETLMALMGARDHDYYTRGDLLGLLGRQSRLMFAPGARFSYSNSNYMLLGMVVERALDGPLDELVRRLLLEPAGMRRSSMPLDVDTVLPGLAGSYRQDADRGLLRTDRRTAVPGASGLFSTVGDLYRWQEARGELFRGDRELWRLLWQDVTLPSGDSAGYCAGMFVQRSTDATPWHHHGGNEYDYSAQAAFAPTGAVAVAVANLAAVDAARLALTAMELLQRGASAEDALRTVTAPAVVAAEEQEQEPTSELPTGPGRAGGRPATGLYRSDDLPLPLRVDLDGDGLVLRRGSQSDELVPLDPGRYRGPGYVLAAVAEERRIRITLPRAGTLEFDRVGS